MIQKSRYYFSTRANPYCLSYTSFPASYSVAERRAVLPALLATIHRPSSNPSTLTRSKVPLRSSSVVGVTSRLAGGEVGEVAAPAAATEAVEPDIGILCMLMSSELDEGKQVRRSARES